MGGGHSKHNQLLASFSQEEAEALTHNFKLHAKNNHLLSVEGFKQITKLPEQLCHDIVAQQNRETQNTLHHATPRHKTHHHHDTDHLDFTDFCALAQTFTKNDPTHPSVINFTFHALAEGSPTLSRESFSVKMKIIDSVFCSATQASSGDDSEGFWNKLATLGFADKDSMDFARFEQWSSSAVCLLNLLCASLRVVCSPPSPVPVLPVLEPKLDNVAGTLLSPRVVWLLKHHLPVSCQVKWQNLYHSARHGQSLNALMSNVIAKGPFVIVVRTAAGDVFGGFVNESLRKHPDFYGNATCFLFTLSPQIQIFPASAMNNNYFYFNMHTQTLVNGIGMGGQMRHFGWFLDERCSEGQSRSTVTFKSPQLTATSPFTIEVVEVWGTDIPVVDEDDADKRGSALKSGDMFLMEMAGRTGASSAVGHNPHEEDDDESNKKS